MVTPTTEEPPAAANVMTRSFATASPARRTGPRAATGEASVLAAFALTLFLSALLLFSVQPIFAKMVLPRLGGTPAVWSVAMVFFQGALLAGYAYAHLLIRCLGLLSGTLVQAAVLVVALWWLPFEVAAGLGPPPESGVALWLIAIFAASLGAPFFAVAANAPLLQAWFARTGHRHAGDPYFLYGASNLGSFFALMAYPILFEPVFTLTDQARWWSAGYGLLAVAVTLCGLVGIARSEAVVRATDRQGAVGPSGAVDWRMRAAWMAFASVPSALLVAVTAHISTNIAAAPFLWVVPLALFLLTFVITFQRRPILPHRAMKVALPVAAVAAAGLLAADPGLGVILVAAVHLSAFFAAAMVCHGELVARRPHAARLTEFYLFMSAGGVLGGAFVTLGAPVLFSTVLEYPLLLGLSLLALPEMRALIASRARILVPLGAAAALVPLLAPTDVVMRERSFFGVITVDTTPDGEFRRFAHGVTVHGAQRVDDAASAARPPVPVTYYAADGLLAGTIRTHRETVGRPIAAGLVGLGVGSLGCFAEAGERWKAYEIDPAVVAVASDTDVFRFLGDCAPAMPVVVGDARLTLADEPRASFDVLVVDAFSSDAIPVHLMTAEAIALYFEKLAPDGLLVLHISNRFMELESVVAANAAVLGLAGAANVQKRSPAEANDMLYSSEAAVLARDASALRRLKEGGWRPLDASATAARAWTDDYSNVLSAILRRNGF